MRAPTAIEAARTSAAVFRLEDRAVLEVRGSDRVRFLQGQLTNDVAALDAAGPKASCYALALTREGRIVADLRVVARADRFWLETDASLADAARERLAKYVVADDVEIADASATFARFAIEGPRAKELVGAAAETTLALERDEVASVGIAGGEVVAVACALAGACGIQLFASHEAGEAIAEALRTAAIHVGGAAGDARALETLRIEAGLPRAGAEIGLETLPAELRLVERAVSFTKGCFTGQEVVTRMHSRGRVGHLLVGIELGATGAPPARGVAVEVGGAKVGEVTSATESPRAGVIALAIVRRGSDAPGTEVVVAGRPARVAALPLVPLPDAP